jgi:hypothetical protein
MIKWLLIVMAGIVLLSGCATFKNWMTTQDAAKLAEELRLIERLLNENQNSQQLYVPPNLGEALSKMKFKRDF